MSWGQNVSVNVEKMESREVHRSEHGKGGRCNGTDSSSPRDAIITKQRVRNNDDTLLVSSASYPIGYPQCRTNRQKDQPELTRASNKCIDRAVGLTPDLRPGSIEMGIEIAPVLWERSV